MNPDSGFDKLLRRLSTYLRLNRSGSCRWCLCCGGFAGLNGIRLLCSLLHLLSGVGCCIGHLSILDLSILNFGLGGRFKFGNTLRTAI